MKRMDKDSYVEHKFKSKSKHTSLSRFFLALSFILAGSILIAEKTGFISNELFHMIFNWQVLVIAIGVVSIFKENNSIGGYIMILIGGIFLIPEFIDINFNTKQLFWPAILIGVGIIILFKGLNKWPQINRDRFTKSDFNDLDMVDDNHIFGGGEFHITSENFKGGKINALFGGGTYDFRNAKLAEGVQVLDISLVFGGLEINIPAEWDVKVEVTSILGGFSNKTLSYSRPAEITGQLIIRGSAIFGGGEIKRY